MSDQGKTEQQGGSGARLSRWRHRAAVFRHGHRRINDELVAAAVDLTGAAGADARSQTLAALRGVDDKIDELIGSVCVGADAQRTVGKYRFGQSVAAPHRAAEPEPAPVTIRGSTNETSICARPLGGIPK